MQKFIPNKVEYNVYDFAYEESEYPKIKGKKFQILLVNDCPKYIPFVSMTDGEEIRKNAIYIRREGETVEANYEELQEVINRRIETAYNSKNENELERQLAQLKVLYKSIPKYVSMLDKLSLSVSFMVENPNYPKETLEEFINKLIEIKKKKIIDMMS